MNCMDLKKCTRAKEIIVPKNISKHKCMQNTTQKQSPALYHATLQN